MFFKRDPDAALRKLIRARIRQGFGHYTELRKIFRIIREEWAAEFYADTRPTHEFDIEDQFWKSMNEYRENQDKKEDA